MDRFQGGRGPDRETDPVRGAADQPTELDWRIVTRQLGRRPRPFTRVCRRCRYDYPQVILTEPLHRHGERWEVFPTVFWLTCPLLHRAISRLEAEGHIRLYRNGFAHDPDFAARMEQAHRDAAAHRVSLVPEDLLMELEARASPGSPRAGRNRHRRAFAAADGVKCLHAHYADFVGRGENLIGQEVHRRLIAWQSPRRATTVLAILQRRPPPHRRGDARSAPPFP